MNSTYDQVFTKDNYKKEYLELIKQYHPDINSSNEAIDITMKLNIMYMEAQRHFKSNTWAKDDKKTILVEVAAKTTKKRIAYRYKESTTTGMCYVGDSILTYAFSKEKYYRNFIKAMNMIVKNDETPLTKYFALFLPRLIDKFKAKTGEYYVILEKSPDEYPLCLVLETFHNNKTHCSWLTTRLMNILVLFEHNDFVHNGISMNNCFVNLKTHGVSLYGGWEFGTPNGQKMIGTNQFVYANMTIQAKNSKISEYMTDRKAAKALIANILTNKENPSYKDLQENGGTFFADFLSSANKGTDSLSEYKRWESMRTLTFNKHEFVEVKDINAKKIYSKGEM